MEEHTSTGTSAEANARTWRNRAPRGEAAAGAGEGQQRRWGVRRIWIGLAACPNLLQQKAPTGSVVTSPHGSKDEQKSKR